jgi:hypothetical protein
MRPDFIVRLRVGGHLPKAGPTSLEAMGRAFMNVDGTGNMVDVYYDQLLFTFVGQTIVFCGLLGRAYGPRNFMKKGSSGCGRMGKRRSEIGVAVAQLRPLVCLIRSTRALSE